MSRPTRHRLGNERPLEIGGGTSPTQRLGLNLRWLGASVLTGLCGALLIGSAIYVSSQGQLIFAEVAERAPATTSGGGEGARGAARKGDKLVRAETVASAKQSYRAPMTLRSGDREIIKARTFTRVVTGLSLTTGAFAGSIPPFNPLRFFSADSGRGAEAGPSEPSDAEVSVVKSDLFALGLDASGPALGDETVLAQLQDEARAAATGERQLPFPSPLGFPRMVAPEASRPTVNAAGRLDPPFRGIEVRVVPENVLDVPKSAARSADSAFEDRVVPVRRGETVETVLRAAGASADETRAILAALGDRDRLAAAEGSQLRLLLAPPVQPNGPRPVVRAILFGERGIESIAAQNDRGAYVSVAPPPVEAARPGTRSGSDEDDDDEGGGVRLYESLYETAAKQDLPRQTVEDLIRIFGYDVDFQRRVAPGDGFELFYALDDDAGPDRLEILSAALTLGTEVRRIFRFQGEDGAVEYLDEAGRSLQKFLLRKPIVEAKLTSGFGTRIHPILGYARAHNGVDWANKTGTPIFAAGAGTLLKAEWDSGYGRRIEIQHANGYVTTYSHMSAFGRGMKPGVRVRQGQVIGFVGSTGLSTGAHLHYEVIVNGHFVDPMKIRVPRGRELDGRALAEFGRQRDQISGLMQRTGSGARFAQRGETR